MTRLTPQDDISLRVLRFAQNDKRLGMTHVPMNTRAPSTTPFGMTQTRLLVAWLALAMPLAAQTPAPSTAERRVLVRAGRLIDAASDAAKTDQGILITGD